MKTYSVKEIFGPTIQGEGSSLGKSVMFLRFTGCNKWSGHDKDKHKSICHFCDTNFIGGEKLSAQDIIDKLKSLSLIVKRVVISGGEPTLQIDESLLKTLKENNYEVHLETNGSKSLGNLLEYFSHISMSPKQNKSETKLEKCDDIKILFPWIRDDITVDEFKFFPHHDMYLQPLWDSNKKETLDYLFSNPKLKLSPQLHKYLELQ